MSSPRCVYETPFRALTAAAAKNKRVLAWFVLASFYLCSCSCYSWKKTPLTSIKPGKKEEAKISAVLTKLGEKIELNKKPAARFQGDFIVGERPATLRIKIEKAKIEKPKELPGSDTHFLLTTIDGDSYRVFHYYVSENIVTLDDAYTPFSISLSKIDFVWIRKLNVLMTVLSPIWVPLYGVLYVFALALAGMGD